LRIITIASQKGGAGKTTIARNLAVAAGRAGHIVGLIDTDPQGSLTAWHERRACEAPLLVALAGPLADAIAVLAEAGCTLIVIDTPPSIHPVIAQAIVAADLVLTPVRPSPDDLDAVGPTLDMIADAAKPFVFVLSLAKPGTTMLADAYPALSQHGRIAPAVLYDRQDYPKAALDGQGVTEQRGGKAAEEMNALWGYVASILGGRKA
jgi:chromosome partitioning protein